MEPITEEVEILVEDQQGNRHCLKIKSPCKYKELKEKLEEMFKIKITNVIFKNCCFENNEEDLKFDYYDRILFNREALVLEGCEYPPSDPLLNVTFIENENDKNVDFGIDVEKVYLSGILNLCLLKYIAKRMDDTLINKIKSESIQNLIKKVRKDLKLTGDPKKDILSILKEESGQNIFEYCKYVTASVKESDLNDLISLFEKEGKKEDAKQIESFWKKLSVYQDFNKLFEDELNKALRESCFDYSVVSIAIYQTSGVKDYIKYKKECDNRITKFLFHGTQKDPISNIVTNKFFYSKRAFYGMGVYFSDMLDYAKFYAGGTDAKTSKAAFGKTLKVKDSFSCIATEVYFNKDKLTKVYDWKYYSEDLDHFPSYKELEKKYKDKMVPMYGINLAQVEPNHGKMLKEEEIKKSKNMVFTAYVVTELTQILPLYCLTLKRKEYFIVWRDNHFKGENNYSDFLQSMRMYLNESADMNVYFESNVESALKIIERKKFNKIILISNIGLDLSGKTFIDVARKILGFNAVVLFLSNNPKHHEWLINYPNALNEEGSYYLKKYVTNYNEEGLKALKKEINEEKKINFPEFTDDFLSFPNFINEGKYKDINFNEKLDNFRHVFIYNQKTDSYLYLNKNGTVTLSQNKDMPLWDVTILDDIITLFRNELYLGINKNKTGVQGEEFMKRWKMIKKGSNGKFNLVSTEKDTENILTIEGNNICLKNDGGNEGALFEFVYY